MSAPNPEKRPGAAVKGARSKKIDNDGPIASDVPSTGAIVTSSNLQINPPHVAPSQFALVDLGSSGDDLLSPSPEQVVVSKLQNPSSPSVPHRVLPMPASPASPGNNRNRFMATCQPLTVACDLSSVGLHNNSMRFSFSAVVLIVYPSSEKPERRHLQLIDSRGSTGLTVWGPHVSLFQASTVGQVVKFSKLSMIMFNGKRGLSMCRDSTIAFPSTLGVATEEAKWWAALLVKSPTRIIDVHDVDNDCVISVCGIIGTLTTELKRVRDETKELLCIRLTDRTGCVDVRSWSHSESDFSSLLERPVMLRRVRVTSFGGMRILELLEGAGTVVENVFAGAEGLLQFWQE